jgi:hypothetical protein
MTADILNKFDCERRSAGELSQPGDIVRELSPDGAECRIVYSRCTADQIDAVIQAEIALAAARHYTLEWKVYGYDTPSCLKDRLLTAGFQPEPVESLMVLPVNEAALDGFAAPALDIRPIRNLEGLQDIAAISREIGRSNVEAEISRLALTLEQTPDEMRIYVAYVAGEPVACGRIVFKENSEFAELCGGRTRTTHRNQGLYTALVAARLRAAFERNRKFVFVDALPTSEPILKKRGFRFVTHSQPFVYGPGLGQARARRSENRP